MFSIESEVILASLPFMADAPDTRLGREIMVL
jgi:hypothetical protein